MTVVRIGLAITIAALLCGCSGGNWPLLSDVNRPPGSDQPVDLRAEAEKTAAAEAAARLDAAARARLHALQDAYAAADKDFAAVYAAYIADLDRLLAAPGERGALMERWTAAQSSLSRMGRAFDGVKAARDALAHFGLDQTRGTAAPPAELAAALQTMADAYGTRQRIMDLETNRLSVLTPASVGSPGPGAFTDDDRTALATIRFGAEAPAFPDFGRTVREIRKTVPDVAFDLIATGPEGTVMQQQAALRDVMRALRSVAVEPQNLMLSLAPEPRDSVVHVRVYLRKTAL